MFQVSLSKLFFLFFCINILFSQIDHKHSHGHNNEIGMAIGLVPGHEGEENNVGLHLHYVKGL